MTNYESHFLDYAAPLRLCMIDGMIQPSILDGNVLGPHRIGSLADSIGLGYYRN